MIFFLILFSLKKNKTKISCGSKSFSKKINLLQIKNEITIEWKRMSRNMGSIFIFEKITSIRHFNLR